MVRVTDETRETLQKVLRPATIDMPASNLLLTAMLSAVYPVAAAMSTAAELPLAFISLCLIIFHLDRWSFLTLSRITHMVVPIKLAHLPKFWLSPHIFYLYLFICVY
jgi:hypothetical protein